MSGFQKTTAEICADARSKETIAPDMAPREFVGALVDRQKFSEAIDFMAHALPPREAVWWGCLCMRHVLGDNLAEADIPAASAAVYWAMWPSEESRVAAMPFGGNIESMASTLAEAAFLSTGNFAPPGAPPLFITQFPTAKAVARAVKLACEKADPAELPRVQEAYLELAMETAEGHFI